MQTLIDGLGIFIYPFLLCSVVATYVFIERWVTLRPSRIFQEDSAESIAGRLAHFIREKTPNLETVRAYLDVEITRMERGMFWLGAIVGVAPLLGLLGTISGLVQVFGVMAQSSADLETNAFVSGIALALTTTMCGLLIAIPSLLGHTILNRRIEKYAAALYLFAQERMSQHP